MKKGAVDLFSDYLISRMVDYRSNGNRNNPLKIFKTYH